MPTYPTLPDTFCIVMRVYCSKGNLIWGDLSDGPVSFDDAADLIIDSFDGDDASEVELSAATVRVLEIDSGVTLDRTEDALAGIASHTTWRGPGGQIGVFHRVYFVESDTAAEYAA